MVFRTVSDEVSLLEVRLRDFELADKLARVDVRARGQVFFGSSRRRRAGWIEHRCGFRRVDGERDKPWEASYQSGWRVDQCRRSGSMAAVAAATASNVGLA
jgi:hypothetical protein